MRQIGRAGAALGVAIVATLASGAAIAVTKSPSSAKACVLPSGALRLATTSGKCAQGQTPLTLGTRGPAGPTGPRGRHGAPGSPGPAGKAIPVNLSQTTVEGTATAPINHYLAQAGPVSFLASCAPGGTAGDVTLNLSVAGEADALSYTASSVSTDAGSSPANAVVHGSTADLATGVFDTDTTSDSLSDVVTVVVAAADGTQVTATLDAEIDASSAPACTVNGTVAAS